MNFLGSGGEIFELKIGLWYFRWILVDVLLLIVGCSNFRCCCFGSGFGFEF